MRRLALGLLLPAMLFATLVLPATAATATVTNSHDDVVLLATEAGNEPLPGRTPRGPNASDNPNPPKDYQANFLWGAGVGLAVLVIGLVLLIAGLYYLLVKRPAQRATAGK